MVGNSDRFSTQDKIEIRNRLLSARSDLQNKVDTRRNFVIRHQNDISKAQPVTNKARDTLRAVSNAIRNFRNE